MKDYFKNLIDKLTDEILGYAGLFIIVGVIWLVINGIDGLRGSNVLKTISLEELSKDNVGKSRNLEIDGCYIIGDYVTEYYDETQVLKVIFPVVTLDEGLKTFPSTKLIVIRNKDKFSPDCGVSNSCLNDLIEFPDEGFTIKGRVAWMGEVDDDVKTLIESVHYDIVDDVIILHEDATFNKKWKSFLMLLGGLALVVLLVVLFLRRSKS